MSNSKDGSNQIEAEKVMSKEESHSKSGDKESDNVLGENSKKLPSNVETIKKHDELNSEIDDDFLSSDLTPAMQSWYNGTNQKTELTIGQLQESIKRKQLILEQLFKRVPKEDNDDTNSLSDDSSE